MNVLHNLASWIAGTEAHLKAVGYEEARFAHLWPNHTRGFRLEFRVKDGWEDSVYSNPGLEWELDRDGELVEEPKIDSREVRELREVLRATAAVERMVDSDVLQSDFARAFADSLRPKLAEARHLLGAPYA